MKYILISNLEQRGNSGYLPVVFHEDGIKWGYTILAGVEPIRWFKLLLKEDDINLESRQDDCLLQTQNALQKSNKTAVVATADYLVGMLLGACYLFSQ